MEPPHVNVNVDAVARAVLREYELPVFGIHGLGHWARVLENGLYLAERTGADTNVVTLFALFHDSRRINEGSDPGHGRRGAELALALRGPLFDLGDEELGLLRGACTLHTDGLTEGSVTVQTCWDADRLDLGRVGITPEPRRLCTRAARDPTTLDWANRRAASETIPETIRALWEELHGEL